MPLKQSKQVRAGAAVPSFDGQESMTITADYTVRTGDASGDIVELHGLPSQSVIIDWTAQTDGLGCTVDAGFLSGELGVVNHSRTMDAALGAAVATTAAGVTRLAVNTIGVARSDDERPFGVKFLGAPVVGRTIRFSLAVQPAPVGM